jgi:hypothetical protein
MMKMTVTTSPPIINDYAVQLDEFLQERISIYPKTRVKKKIIGYLSIPHDF